MLHIYSFQFINWVYDVDFLLFRHVSTKKETNTMFLKLYPKKEPQGQLVS